MLITLNTKYLVSLGMDHNIYYYFFLGGGIAETNCIAQTKTNIIVQSKP